MLFLCVFSSSISIWPSLFGAEFTQQPESRGILPLGRASPIRRGVIQGYAQYGSSYIDQLCSGLLLWAPLVFSFYPFLYFSFFSNIILSVFEYLCPRPQKQQVACCYWPTRAVLIAFDTPGNWQMCMCTLDVILNCPSDPANSVVASTAVC